MESRAKLFGHPIHPMLIVFPLGLFVTALVFDIIYLVTDNTRWSDAAFLMIAGGVVGGVAAAVFGVIDWLAIPNGTRAKKIGLLHGMGNAAVVILFIMSWFFRLSSPTSSSTVAVALAVVGVLLSALTGWLGGELVDRLGVGVDDGAHVNAPSSLSGLPAAGAAPARERAYVE